MEYFNLQLNDFRVCFSQISCSVLRKACIILICSIPNLGILYAQNVSYGWAMNMGGNTADNGKAVARDGNGNVYVTGIFTGTADFNSGGAGGTLTAAGNEDVFLAKYDRNGDYLWAKRMGGNSSDQVFAVAADNTGNVYITGSFTGTADFNPGGTGGGLTASGNEDVFLAGYAPDGSFLWAKRMGGSDPDKGLGVALDGTGNIYVTGSFQGTADFNPGGTGGTFTTQGGEDVFLAKYASGGSFLWAKGMGSSGEDDGRAVAVDGSGNVYITGNFGYIAFGGAADFNPGGAGGTLTSADLIFPDMFLAKYDAGGNYLWAKGMGGVEFEWGNGIAVDAARNVYVTGSYTGAADFNPGGSGGTLPAAGPEDLFVLKCDSSGDYLWCKNTGNSGSFVAGRSVALDGAGNVYVTGFFNGPADFDPGAGTNTLSPAGSWDVFVASYAPNGDHVWAERMGGSGADEAYGIVVDGTNNVYVTGLFNGSVNFNPWGSGGTLASAGDADIFLLKLSQRCEVFTDLTESACGSFTFNDTVYTATGIYTDTFTSVLSCDSIVTLDLTIIPAPVATVSRNGAVLTAGSADSYQWINCGDNTAIPGADDQDYTASASGSYAVIVTENGCSDTSECVLVEDGAGINAPGAGNVVRLYPNPADSRIVIQTQQALKHATIRFVNMTGQLLTEQFDQEGTLFVLDIEQYPDGIYFLEISEGSHTVRMKVIKR